MNNPSRDQLFQAAMNEATQQYLERIGTVAETFGLDYGHVLWEELRLLFKLAIANN